MQLDFVKFHGLGNDFAVIDARALEVDFLGPRGQRLCDRHFGLGADGLLLWTGSVQEPVMTVVNADGSPAEMCGNGLRCFAKYLGDRHLPDAREIVVQTGAGPLSCQLERDDRGRVVTVAVAMGRGRFEPEAVPLARDRPLIDEDIHVGGTTVRVTALGTGNPHVVTFDSGAHEDRLRLGPALGSHTLFPKQANVGFARLRDGKLLVDVFERGCGWTLACGTGATAAAIAAVRLGMLPVGTEVPVRLPGGWLAITVASDFSAVMRGPAVEVFTGSLDLQAFEATWASDDT